MDHPRKSEARPYRLDVRRTGPWDTVQTYSTMASARDGANHWFPHVRAHLRIVGPDGTWTCRYVGPHGRRSWERGE